jgi:hypothetical protein
VELRYSDLVKTDVDLSAQIEEVRVLVRCLWKRVPSESPNESHPQAFGQNGLGLLTVSGVPTLEEKRGRLLPMARKFAELPDAVRPPFMTIMTPTA